MERGTAINTGKTEKIKPNQARTKQLQLEADSEKKTKITFDL